jgi:hypothetical protein
MKKFIVLSIPFLLLLSGCVSVSTNATFTPVDGLSSFKIGSRTAPAKISTEPDKALEEKGYVDIGFVQFEDHSKTCWGKECQNFECTDSAPHKDMLKEMLEKAAAHGGDLLVLGSNGKSEMISIHKEGGRCIAWGDKVFQVQYCCQYGNGYCLSTCTRTETRTVCTATEGILGSECYFWITGRVWRYDPELMKPLAEFTKKKEGYLALKKTYEETLADKCDLISFYDVVRDKRGFKDKDGKIVIEPQFHQVSFTYCRDDSLIAVSTGEGDNEVWGFIDKAGKWVIRPAYEEAYDFSEGLAPVKVNKKWGYVNKDGKMVIKPQNTYGFGFNEGLALILPEEDKMHFGYIDKTGNIIIKPKFDEGSDFTDGLARVKINNKYGYIDKKGNIIIEPQFDDASAFREGLAGVKINNKYGYIDKKGIFIIKPQFDNAYQFFKGIAKVKIGEKEGYINKSGEVFMLP